MKTDLHIIRFDWADTPSAIGPGLAHLARTAEHIGVGTLSLMDHWFQMDHIAPAEDPMLEGYTTLGYLAAATETLRLRLLVTGVMYRHPGLLAKTVTTLDVLSAGRAELGVGAAWYEREHRGLGVPFPPTAERFERLEETLQICLKMWEPGGGTFNGRHYQLAETLCSPPPVSQPRPRIIIGGGGERKTLRLVAQYADACNIMGDFATVAHKIDVIKRHCEDVGRDPNEIEVTVLPSTNISTAGPDALLAEAEQLAELGVTTIVTGIVGDHPAAELERSWSDVIGRVAEITPRPLA